MFFLVAYVELMDDDGLNIRNWGYYEPSFKEHMGLQLMDTKPFISSRENLNMLTPNGGATAATAYHHQSIPLHYIRDSWIQRDRLLHMLPGNPEFALVSDTSVTDPIHMMQSVDHGINVDDIDGGDDDTDSGNGPLKKRSVAAAATATQTRGVKKPKTEKQNRKPTGQRSKIVKWNLDMVINGVDMEITGIPIPVCSCTGAPQQCYRWRSGGWQSACTTTISIHPLPMSAKRRGARIAGRKMSQGAFKKVLEKLASEGYDFADAIDLRTHWAKHGTNKFVTIR